MSLVLLSLSLSLNITHTLPLLYSLFSDAETVLRERDTEAKQ
jgi:hypothetical protein